MACIRKAGTAHDAGYGAPIGGIWLHAENDSHTPEFCTDAASEHYDALATRLYRVCDGVAHQFCDMRQASVRIPAQPHRLLNCARALIAAHCRNGTDLLRCSIPGHNEILMHAHCAMTASSHVDAMLTLCRAG